MLTHISIPHILNYFIFLALHVIEFRQLMRSKTQSKYEN